MSVYTAALTWINSTPVAKDYLNQAIGAGGNIEYVLGNKGLNYTDYSGGNKTLSIAASFTDVDATNAIVSCTTKLGRILVVCQGVLLTGNAGSVTLDLYETTGGTYASTGTSTAGTRGVFQVASNVASAAETTGFNIWGWFPNTGANTTLQVNLRYKATVAGILYASSESHLHMWAFEF
jgi:hypothetical protein